jgi:NAD(P)-dependent dehydrogenase (short-subunit alcohol dehydrogenase family)
VARGGEALASAASVADMGQVEAMVASAMTRWGRVDILVNNAGILRDKSFGKMDMADFRAVVDVHLMGSVYCTKAVWDIMTAQNYGRIVMTTSSSGLYGNFGQANYAAAKMALVGLMQTLAIEGKRNGIHVNCLAPTAATRMMEGLLPAEMVARLTPDVVSPGLLALVAEDAPTRAILCAGAGSFERPTGRHLLGRVGNVAYIDAARKRHVRSEIGNLEEAIVPESAWAQGKSELEKAGLAVV